MESKPIHLEMHVQAFRETFGLSFAGEYRTNDFGAQKGHESC